MITRIKLQFSREQYNDDDTIVSFSFTGCVVELCETGCLVPDRREFDGNEESGERGRGAAPAG